MRKILVGLASVALGACAVFAGNAEIDAYSVSASVVGTSVSTSTVPVKGELLGVTFTVPATNTANGVLGNSTGKCTVAYSDGQVIFEVSGKTVGTYRYQPQVGTVGTNGVANIATASAGTNYAHFAPMPIIDDVKVYVTGQSPAAYTSANYTVKLIYRQ